MQVRMNSERVRKLDGRRLLGMKAGSEFHSVPRRQVDLYVYQPSIWKWKFETVWSRIGIRMPSCLRAGNKGFLFPSFSHPEIIGYSLNRTYALFFGQELGSTANALFLFPHGKRASNSRIGCLVQVDNSINLTFNLLNLKSQLEGWK